MSWADFYEFSHRLKPTACGAIKDEALIKKLRFWI